LNQTPRQGPACVVDWRQSSRPTAQLGCGLTFEKRRGRRGHSRSRESYTDHMVTLRQRHRRDHPQPVKAASWVRTSAITRPVASRIEVRKALLDAPFVEVSVSTIHPDYPAWATPSRLPSVATARSGRPSVSTETTSPSSKSKTFVTRTLAVGSSVL
jgi:hypothetical protein